MQLAMCVAKLQLPYFDADHVLFPSLALDMFMGTNFYERSRRATTRCRFMRRIMPLKEMYNDLIWILCFSFQLTTYVYADLYDDCKHTR